MNSLEWSFVDKSEWPRGPWDAEPDKMQWTDEATGLPCLVHRAPRSGALCGYVGVPEDHAWFGIPYDDVPEGPDVHGGLTYSDFCQPMSSDDGSGRGICHQPEADESDKVWWFGFDCAHAFDVLPGLERPSRWSDDEEYRDLAYVRAECARLAKQLAAA